jgi:CIC family chloride channel protein
MLVPVSASAQRFKVLFNRLMARFGLGEDAFVLLLAVIVGLVTAVAAVGFHELINLIRDALYTRLGPDLLYGRAMFLLIAIPALGGLIVGVTARYVFKTREGHGVIDVIESVARSSGFQRPATAVEKILTSAVTIGTGGSAGAEGPIVQIGAGIASGVGQLFRLARPYMPVLIGCGSAAGISSIFNAPFGGVLFTLEVILQDFSTRTITPVVLASVVAQVTTMALFQFIDYLHGAGDAVVYKAIFAMPPWEVERHAMLNWSQFGNFVALGLFCGAVGVALTIAMHRGEIFFNDRVRLPRPLRPALGGAMLGVIGIVYVLIFGRVLLGAAKPFPFDVYSMPAFYGDGYGVVQELLDPRFYHGLPVYKVLLLLTFLVSAKVVGTSLTLSSGGSGGVIAPSIFLGACGGALLGILLRATGWFGAIQPEIYALVGMGAVLAAVVHAPMAAILIVFELTQDYKVMLPAMLACIAATGTAKVIYRDSIYTMSLRRRGVRTGMGSDLRRLHRVFVEQVPLEPAVVVQPRDPLQRVLDLMSQMSASNFVVIDEQGLYKGVVVERDVNTALMQREAVPLMVVGELMRSDVPMVKTSDDLAGVLDVFARFDVSHLPVCLATGPGKVIGLISRAGLMRHYHAGMSA